MITFNQFLENKRPDSPMFTMYSGAGKIRVIVGGKKYEYDVDPSLHDKLKEKAVYKPFSALNYTKNIATATRKVD